MSIQKKFEKVRDENPPSRRRANKALLDMMTKGQTRVPNPEIEMFTQPGIQKLKPGRPYDVPGVVVGTPRHPDTVTPFREGQLSVEELKKHQPISKGRFDAIEGPGMMSRQMAKGAPKNKDRWESFIDSEGNQRMRDKVTKELQPRTTKELAVRSKGRFDAITSKTLSGWRTDVTLPDGSSLEYGKVKPITRGSATKLYVKHTSAKGEPISSKQISTAGPGDHYGKLQKIVEKLGVPYENPGRQAVAEATQGTSSGKFDAIRGGSGKNQPRVPAGNPRGGQWAKK